MRLEGTGKPKAPAPARFDFDRAFELGSKEPSGLEYLPELDRFVSVDDASHELELLEVRRKRLRSESLKTSGKGESQYEGVAYDPERRRLLTVNEKTRRIRTFQILADERDRPRLRELDAGGRLPKLGKDPNKGIEGLAFLPAALAWDGRSHLVAVHQTDPKAVLLLDPETFELQSQLALPRQWDRDVYDLSDVAVDPLSGHLFVISAGSRQLLELELREKDGEPDLRGVGRSDIEVKGTGEIPQAEGLAFDAHGNLFLSSEGSRQLYRYQRR
jgi:uncharacterized protein YjiK